MRIAVTVRELLDGLWPPRRDKRGWLDRDVRHNWPKLLDALYRARDWTVPDAGGGRWFPMALRRLPPSAADNTPALDDLVVLDLAPPPGAVHGSSVVLPWLDRMGVTSGPQWRAYITGRSLIWVPGTTRRPVPKTDRQRYGWSRDPEDYPVLTLDDLRRLAFGDRDAKNRTRAAIPGPLVEPSGSETGGGDGSAYRRARLAPAADRPRRRLTATGQPSSRRHGSTGESPRVNRGVSALQILVWQGSYPFPNARARQTEYEVVGLGVVAARP